MSEDLMQTREQMLIAQERQRIRRLQDNAKLDEMAEYLGIPASTLASLRAGTHVVVAVEILDRFPEINPSNYNDEDVCALNNWGVEVVLAAAPEDGRDGR